MKRKIIYTLATLVACAGLVKGVSSGIALLNRLEERRDNETTRSYLELKKLADIDDNGTLSDVEKRLLYERLDASKGYTDIQWKHLANITDERIERNDITWIPSDMNRIHHALSIYKKEAESYGK